MTSISDKRTAITIEQGIISNGNAALTQSSQVSNPGRQGTDQDEPLQEEPSQEGTSLEELQSDGSASAFEGSEFLVDEEMPRHNKRDPNDPSGLEDY